MPFAPTTRVDLLLEGGKRASERKGAPRGEIRQGRHRRAIEGREGGERGGSGTFVGI